MKKHKIITDIDGTMINSGKRITELYHEDFHLYPNYVPTHWTDIKSYTFSELSLADDKIILDYFSDFRFFDKKKLEFMDNAKEVLTELYFDGYEIMAATLGTKTNLRFKEEFLHNNLPFIKLIGLDISIYKDKSSIDMRKSVYFEDVQEYLIHCNSPHPVIFGEKYDWNTPEMYPRVYNWTEAKNMTRCVEYFD